MNVVSLALCYPDAHNPRAGLFIRHRLSALSASNNVRVVHPVPTPFWRPRPPLRSEAGPPPVWHVPMSYLPMISKPLNPMLVARCALPHIQHWHPWGNVDIIDAHFSWPEGVAASAIARQLKVPYVVTLRGVLARFAADSGKRRAIVAALRGAGAVIAVSQSLKRLAVDLGIAGDRIHVIPNGVDRALFSPGDRDAARSRLGIPHDRKLLLTVGHLCKRKGFHRVIELLPALRAAHPGVHYVIVGDDAAEGAFRETLLRLVRRLGLDHCVTFTGPLAPRPIADWLRAADLFVLPTTNEGCCNALLEAVATGLPVVCTDVGGNREIVSPTAGMIVPPNNDTALHAAIMTMLSTRTHRTAVARAANVRDWSRVAHETASVLRNAIYQFGRSANRPDHAVATT